MEKVKTITNVPGWAETFTTGGQAHNSAGSYAAVPLVYRCVRLISDALSSVPVVVRKGEAKVSLPFEFDISEWVWRTTASLLLTGASYSVKLKSKSGRVLGLQWLNPTTVSINLVSGQPEDPLALEKDLPAPGRQKTGDRVEQGGLAGPVSPEEGHDLPVFHGERNPFQGCNLPVKGVDVFNLQHARSPSCRDRLR